MAALAASISQAGGKNVGHVRVKNTIIEMHGDEKHEGHSKNRDGSPMSVRGFRRQTCPDIFDGAVQSSLSLDEEDDDTPRVLLGTQSLNQERVSEAPAADGVKLKAKGSLGDAADAGLAPTPKGRCHRTCPDNESQAAARRVSFDMDENAYQQQLQSQQPEQESEASGEYSDGPTPRAHLALPLTYDDFGDGGGYGRFGKQEAVMDTLTPRAGRHCTEDLRESYCWAQMQSRPSPMRVDHFPAHAAAAEAEYAQVMGRTADGRWGDAGMRVSLIDSCPAVVSPHGGYASPMARDVVAAGQGSMPPPPPPVLPPQAFTAYPSHLSYMWPTAQGEVPLGASSPMAYRAPQSGYGMAAMPPNWAASAMAAAHGSSMSAMPSASPWPWCSLPVPPLPEHYGGYAAPPVSLAPLMSIPNSQPHHHMHPAAPQHSSVRGRVGELQRGHVVLSAAPVASCGPRYRGGEAGAAPEAAARGPRGGGRRLRLWAHIYLHMQVPGFDLVPRLIGRGGCNMRRIADRTGAKLRIRGRGSGHLEIDGEREAPTPLMVAVTTDKGDAHGFRKAIELTINELASVEQKFHVFCRQEGIVHEGPCYSVGLLPDAGREALGEIIANVPVAESTAAGR